MMDKKAKFSDILMDNIIYLILLIVFFVGMLAFVNSKMNGAYIYEDRYAKNVALAIDASMPGDILVLDVHEATEIAKKNNVPDLGNIFTFNNPQNKICVRLSLGNPRCYKYFNDVGVTYDTNESQRWIYFAETAESRNRLHLKIIEKGESLQ